jgi:hypothetical protein
MSYKDFDDYGRPAGTQTDNIEPGDLVEYLDAKSAYVNGKKVRKIEPLHGIWDGEKVQFDDPERTVVRAKPWLKLLVKNLHNVIGK